MSSFYGGKQGRTYNIVYHYPSIQDMASSFSSGGAYTTVMYGQYVIINTESQFDISNGILYRRGLNYSEQVKTESQISKTDELGNITPEYLDYIHNPGGGAIYVGKISGPEGKWGNSLTEFTIQDSKIYYKVTAYDNGQVDDDRSVENTYYMKELKDIEYDGDFLIVHYSPTSSTSGDIEVNLGPVGSEYHVYGNINVQDVIENGQYYSGFPEGSNRQGWIATISRDIYEGTTIIDTQYDFYIFDYYSYIADPDNPPYQIEYNGNEYGTFWYKIANPASLQEVIKIIKGSQDQHYSIEDNTHILPLYNESYILSFKVYGGNDNIDNP